jgi:hypothetical protein
MEMLSATSVIVMRLYITYSLIARLLSLYGELCI